MTEDRDANGEFLPDELRLTSYGKWLRATSLDELPELLNILKGEMSFVGPRPLPTKYVERYLPWQKERLNLRPGLTGLAQVRGRNAITWRRRFQYDVFYVKRMNFFWDLQILMETFAVVLKRDGISAKGDVTMSEFQ